MQFGGIPGARRAAAALVTLGFPLVAASASAASWATLLDVSSTRGESVAVFDEGDGALLVHDWFDRNSEETALTRFDEAGRVLWSRRHADARRLRASAAARTEDGTLHVVGSVEREGGPLEAHAWRSDDAGGVLAAHAAWLAETGTEAEYLDVAALPGGGRLSLARVQSPTGTRLVLERRSAQLQPELVREILPALAGEPWLASWPSWAPGAVAPLSDGRLAVTAVRSDPAGDPLSWLALLDADWRVLRQVELRTGAGERILATRLDPLPGGGFVAAGRISDEVGREAPWIARFDAGAGLAWERRLDTPENAFVSAQLAASDGTVAAAVSVRGLTGRDLAALARFDADGALLDTAGFELATGDGSLVVDALAEAPDGLWAGLHWSRLGLGATGLLRWQPGTLLEGSCLAAVPYEPSAAPAGPTLLEPLDLPWIERPNWSDAPAEARGLPALAPPSCGPCVPDRHEPDDRCGQSQPLGESGTSLSLNACDDPEDWFDLGSCPGRRWVLRTFELGANADTILEIVDEDCETVLASDDDGGGGAASLLAWTAPDERRAWLRVRQADGGSGPDRDYRLEQRMEEPQPGWQAGLEPALGSPAQVRVAAVLPSPAALRVVGMRAPFPDPTEHWLVELTGGGAPRTAASWFEDDDLFDHEPVSASALPSGGFAVAARRYDRLAGRYLGTRLSVRDPNGERVAAWRLADLDPVTVAAGPGDEILIGGSLLASEDAAIVALDAAGAISWTLALDVAGERDRVGSLAPRSAGGWWAAGTSLEGGAGVQWLARLSTAGEVDWARRFELSGATGLLRLAALPIGGAVVALELLEGSSTDLAALRFDDDGGLVWATRWDLGVEEHLGGLAPRPDGSVVAVGDAWSAFRSPLFAAALALDDGTVAAVDTGLESGHGGLARVADLGDGRVAVAAPRETLVQAAVLDASLAVSEVCGATAPWPVVSQEAPAVAPAPLAFATPAAAVTVEPVNEAPRAFEPVVRPGCDCTCDLAGEPAELSPPGAAEALRVERGGLVRWEPPENAGACRASLFRGLVRDLHDSPFRGAACLGEDLAGQDWIDPERPGEGACFYYLVAGRETASRFPGTLGNASDGSPRRYSSCPR